MEGRHHFTFLVLFLLMNGINGQNNEDNSLDNEYGMTDQPDIEQNVTECPDPVQNFLGYLGERGLKIEAIEGQLAQKDQQISQLTNKVNELEALQVPKIIFNAKKTDGGHAFNGKITFNQITLNVGNGMTSDGFVAPIAGHYKMSFSAMGGIHKYGINTYVEVYKNGSVELWIGHRNNAKENDGNNISYDWIWKLNKGDKVTFRVPSTSYLRARSDVPLNFNGELVFVET